MSRKSSASSTGSQGNKKAVSAFFHVLHRRDNDILVRRYAAVDVMVYGSKFCEKCTKVIETLKRYSCVVRVGLSPPKSSAECHGKVDVYNSTTRKPLKRGIRVPKTYNSMVSTLNKLLRIGRPFRPLAHQKRMIERHKDTLGDGLLIAFALGSGKTHSSLGLLDAAGETSVTAIADLSLLNQWLETLQCHAPPQGRKTPITEYRLLGYQRFEAIVYEEPDFLEGGSVIVDEAHRYKNMTASMMPAIEGLKRADHVLALTGTPIRNDVRDLDLIMELVGRSDLVAPLEEGEERRDGPALSYIGREPPNPYGSRQARQRLLEGLWGLVAEYNPKYCESERKYHAHYPRTVESVVNHRLRWQQVAELAFYGQGVSIKVNGTRVNVGATGGVLRRLSILNAVVDPETKEVYSSKADCLVEQVKSVGGYPQVAYSRFRANMLEPLATRLREVYGVRVETLTGETKVPDRDRILRDYNKGDVQLLLICRVGGQGLDLTAPTTALHLLEPQHNRAEEDQVIGRVVRFSKENLGQRAPIKIIRYVCEYPTQEPTKAEAEFIGDMVNADARLVRAFTGKHFTGKQVQRGEAEKVSYGQIMRFIREGVMAEGGETEEQRMSKANIVKYRRTFPLEVVLWMASGTDTKGKGVPKYWREEWLKLQDPAKARKLEQARKKRKKKASSSKAKKAKKPKLLKASTKQQVPQPQH